MNVNLWDCISNGHTGDATFLSSPCLAYYIRMFEICSDTTTPLILLRFMHMNRINACKIAKLWQLQPNAICNMK